MKRSEYEEIYKDVVDFLEQMDDEDRKHILVDYETEEVEPDFMWEYAHESLTEIDSIFMTIHSDSDHS